MLTHVLRTVLHRGCDAEVRFWKERYETAHKSLVCWREIADEMSSAYAALLDAYKDLLKANIRNRRKYLALHKELKKYRDMARSLEDALALKSRDDRKKHEKLMMKLQPVCSHRHSRFPKGCDICGSEDVTAKQDRP